MRSSDAGTSETFLDCLRELRVLAHHMVLPFRTLYTRAQGGGGLPPEILLDRLGMGSA